MEARSLQWDAAGNRMEGTVSTLRGPYPSQALQTGIRRTPGWMPAWGVIATGPFPAAFACHVWLAPLLRDLQCAASHC